MIEQHYEHSFDIDMINRGGWGIDFGCGNDFFITKTMLKFGLKVIAVDPNPTIVNPPNLPNLYFENKALVCDPEVKSLSFNIYNDADAATAFVPKNDVSFVQRKDVITVNTTTIDSLMKKYDIEQFEILKLDIEGGEYDFLMTIDKPLARQLSIEFHDFRGLNPYYPNNEEYYKRLIDKLSIWYNVAKHKLEKHPGLNGPQSYNYWDSLFVLK